MHNAGRKNWDNIMKNKKIAVLAVLGLTCAGAWGMNSRENNHERNRDCSAFLMLQTQSEQPMIDVFHALYDFYGVRFRIGEVENLFAALHDFVNRDLIYVNGLQDSMRETMDIIMRGPELSWIDIIDRWEMIRLYLEHIEYDDGNFRIANPDNQ